MDEDVKIKLETIERDIDDLKKIIQYQIFAFFSILLSGIYILLGKM